MRWRPSALRSSSNTTPSSNSDMRCAAGSMVSQASSADSGAGNVRKNAIAGVSSSPIVAEDWTLLRAAIDQAMEYIHVAKGESSLFRGDHDVLAAQFGPRLRRHIERNDAVELIRCALAQFTGRLSAIGQRQFILAAFVRRLTPTPSKLVAERRFLAAIAVATTPTHIAPALRGIAAAAEVNDRAKQQRHRNRDPDSQQGHVRHPNLLNAWRSCGAGEARRFGEIDRYQPADTGLAHGHAR
jgi:hypothetical protein